MGNQNTHTIADIERDTGLSKDTLRVWERRYGFPQPTRDALGERRYGSDQLQRLRHIRRLLDAGHRPGKVVPLPLAQLLALDIPAATAPPPGGFSPPSAAPMGGPDLEHWMSLLREHRSQDLAASMQQWLLAYGLGSLVRDGIAPMNQRVGMAWMMGELAVFEEHLYSELVQRLMRAGLAQVADTRSGRGPRVLLSTVPGEAHSLGLLMAECMLVLEACETVSLGIETPLRDIVDAARTCRADVVALGFSPVLNPRDVRGALAQLRLQLAPGTELWTGGDCPALQRLPRGSAPLSGHTHMSDLAQIPAMVAQWRKRQQAEIGSA